MVVSRAYFDECGWISVYLIGGSWWLSRGVASLCMSPLTWLGGLRAKTGSYAAETAKARKNEPDRDVGLVEMDYCSVGAIVLLVKLTTCGILAPTFRYVVSRRYDLSVNLSYISPS